MLTLIISPSFLLIVNSNHVGISVILIVKFCFIDKVVMTAYLRLYSSFIQ